MRDEFIAMDWPLWTFIVLVLLCVSYARERDEDAELTESFYRLLDYDDDFQEFLKSRHDEQFAYNGDNLDRYDADSEVPKKRYAERLLDGIDFYKKKKRDPFDRVFKNERKHSKRKDEVDRESSLEKDAAKTKASLHKKDTVPSHHIHNSNSNKVKENQRDAVSNVDKKVVDSVAVLDVDRDDVKPKDPVATKRITDSDESDVVADAGTPTVQTTAGTTTLPKTQVVSTKKDTSELNDLFFVIIVVACSLACIAGLTLAAYCWYRLRRETKHAEEAETAPFKGGAKDDKKLKKSDEKLAKSAEMYHYVHSKNQLTAMHAKNPGKDPTKDDASDSSEDESDNTIYECSGLAPPGDMKVVNPLFADDNRQSDAKSEGSASPTRDIHHSSPGPSVDPPPDSKY